MNLNRFGVNALGKAAIGVRTQVRRSLGAASMSWTVPV